MGICSNCLNCRIVKIWQLEVVGMDQCGQSRLFTTILGNIWLVQIGPNGISFHWKYFKLVQFGSLPKRCWNVTFGG